MWSSAHRRLGFRAVALGHHSLTWVHHLPPGGPPLFPVSLWMPLEMSPFGCWGLPTALLALFCCPGELVPGVGDLARASPEGGLPAPLASGMGGGAGPEVTEALNTVAAYPGYWMLCQPGSPMIPDGGVGKLAFWMAG